MTEIVRFDPGACHFPRPAVPLLPALRWNTLGRAGATGLLDVPGAVHFARGRYALHAAYRLAGVGPGRALLAPAYHCRTMIDPALALAAPLLFYRLNADLSPDLASLREQLALRPAAVVLPHYFGVEQAPALVAEVAALCRAARAMLVEDCAHAWQVAEKRVPLRAGAGHAIVASPYKFFACADGGVLWAEPGALSTSPPSLAEEARGLRALWQMGRGQRLPAAVLPDASALPRGSERRDSGSGPSRQYLPALADKASLACSRAIVRRSPRPGLQARRRAHYRQWQQALAGLDGGRALFPDLPADCAPYMFALLVDRPDPVFFQLKQAGMPIWRWDEMAVSPCPVAAAYRLQLLHLPCHQDLGPAQLDWMTALAAKALA
jgi:perosamine synthetase